MNENEKQHKKSQSSIKTRVHATNRTHKTNERKKEKKNKERTKTNDRLTTIAKDFEGQVQGFIPLVSNIKQQYKIDSLIDYGRYNKLKTN